MTNLKHLSKCSCSSVSNVVGTQVEAVYPGVACTTSAAALSMRILKPVRAYVLIGLNQSSRACVQPVVKGSIIDYTLTLMGAYMNPAWELC